MERQSGRNDLDKNPPEANVERQSCKQIGNKNAGGQYGTPHVANIWTTIDWQSAGVDFLVRVHVRITVRGNIDWQTTRVFQSSVQ